MVNKRRIIAAFIIIVLVFLIISGCSKNFNKINDEPVSKTEFLLGTMATIKIYDDVEDKVFNEIFKRLREIEDKMTINREDSEIVDINSRAGKDFVKVSEDTFYVVKKGKYFSELSKGKFDISIGPLVKLWNIGTEYEKIPDKEEINSKKALINYDNIILNESKKNVMLKEEGMILDLGGIAKGYAADEVVKIFKKYHINHAIINLGGNVFAWGNKPDGDPWKIGVQNPISTRGEYIGIAQVTNQTVVTSGIYERYIEKDGKRYHHILDPDTGYPVENKLIGISIIAGSSIDADSLSTGAFALGLYEGIELIEKLDGIEAVFITEDLEVYRTSGLRDSFKLTDSNFKLVN